MQSVTVEEIYSALNYGKIVRFRGIQCWLGEDERGKYVEVRTDVEGNTPASKSNRVGCEIVEESSQRRDTTSRGAGSLSQHMLPDATCLSRSKCKQWQMKDQK